MKRFGLNSGYIGVDRRQTEAGIAPLQKAYLERVRGGGYNPVIPLLLDLYPNASVAYSLRKLRTAYTGNAMRVRRSSDNTEQDIGFNGSELDTSALTSFCSGTNGFVTTWYDQSGNSRNATQATAANQPRIVNAGIVENMLSKPSILHTSGNSFLTLSSVVLSNDYSLIGVIKFNSLNKEWLGTPSYGIYNEANAIYHNFAGPIGASFGTLPSLPFLRKAGNTASLFNNGSLLGAFSGLGSFSFSSLSGEGSAYNMVGYISETIVYATDQSTNRSGIESNINSYYNIY